MGSEGGSHLCLTEIPGLLWDEVIAILSSFESEGHPFPMQISWPRACLGCGVGRGSTRPLSHRQGLPGQVNEMRLSQSKTVPHRVGDSFFSNPHPVLCSIAERFLELDCLPHNPVPSIHGLAPVPPVPRSPPGSVLVFHRG